MTRHKHNKLKLSRLWRSFGFKHTLSAVIAMTVFVLALDTSIIQTLLNDITALGYPGILLTGVLFVSFFTAAPAVALLLTFADTYNPFVVAALAGTGSVLGDYIILKFAEDKIAHELKPVAKRLKLMRFINLLHRKRFKPVTATVGAVIIASPFPDEAGLALLGLSRMSTFRLLVLTLTLNCAGVLGLIAAFN